MIKLHRKQRLEIGRADRLLGSGMQDGRKGLRQVGRTILYQVFGIWLSSKTNLTWSLTRLSLESRKTTEHTATYMSEPKL